MPTLSRFYKYQSVPAIPWFGQPSMGTQYEPSGRIEQLVTDSVLKRLP
ncbi:glycohydrolase toxin TNT-related protein [Xenorhabdus bovienii]